MFTIAEEGEIILRFNFPICMIASIGGSVMMLIVNGITWYRMWLAYLRMRRVRVAKRKADAAAAAKNASTELKKSK